MNTKEFKKKDPIAYSNFMDEVGFTIYDLDWGMRDAAELNGFKYSAPKNPGRATTKTLTKRAINIVMKKWENQ